MSDINWAVTFEEEGESDIQKLVDSDESEASARILESRTEKCHKLDLRDNSVRARNQWQWGPSGP